ncbi:MAG: 50S ribosomal protein L21 [Anaerolineales bacterium]|nr:50S ribosomal protein L21 [Anaerolineales bacterium]
MEYAIVESGGKQYKAVPGGTIEVDRLHTEVGDEVVLEKVLLHNDGKKVNVGQPIVAGASVKTTVVAQIKAPKVIVFKYRPRNRYRVKTGHRQKYTRLQIDSIDVAKKKKPRKAKAEQDEAEAAEE